MPQRPLRALRMTAVVAALVALVATCTGGQGAGSPIPGSPGASPTASTASTPPSAPAAPSAAASPAPSASTGTPATPAPSTAPSASPSVEPSPSGSPDPYAGVLFECFGITFPAEFLLGEVDTPAAPSAGEFRRWLDEDADDTVPRDGWRLLAEAGDGALYGTLLPVGGESPAFVVTIREAGGAWQAEDFGACTPTVLLNDELGAATWEPDGQFDAATQEFDALVTEFACASGQSSQDRVSEPRIVVDEDTITVTFGVTPLDQNQDCQSNPPSRVRVELPEPLGSRQLRDGGVYPPRAVHP